MGNIEKISVVSVANFIKMFDEAYKQEDRAYLNQIQKDLMQSKINLGIDWFMHKIKELGGFIKDEVEFRKDLIKYAEDSSQIDKITVIFCTAPTFMEKKYKKKSLADILAKHDIHVFDKGYMVNVIIRKSTVTVVDGLGGAKRTVAKKGEKFVYSTPMELITSSNMF